MLAWGFHVSRIFACFSLILLSFAALACSGEPSPANGVSGGTPTPIPAPTPISVSAEALQSEKELNEVAWKNKYNDNIALITGTIDSITEAGNKYDVKLETGIFTVDVVCKVDKADESTVLSLQQGQTVNVLGRVTDDGILDIVVKDCSIASSGGAPQPAGQAQTAAPTTPAATPAPTATTAAATASPTTTLALLLRPLRLQLQLLRLLCRRLLRQRLNSRSVGYDIGQSAVGRRSLDQGTDAYRNHRGLMVIFFICGLCTPLTVVIESIGFSDPPATAGNDALPRRRSLVRMYPAPIPWTWPKPTTSSPFR